MIFVTVGTHDTQFTRLIKRIDEIAPKINEKIVVQRGFTKFKPKNVESFRFKNSLDPYFREARLVVSHSATSIIELSLKYQKPLIIVPRQKKYKEHINDHQVEFAIYFSEKTGAKTILDVNEITHEFLKQYKNIPQIKKDQIIGVKSFFRNLFEKEAGKLRKGIRV